MIDNHFIARKKWTSSWRRYRDVGNRSLYESNQNLNAPFRCKKAKGKTWHEWHISYLKSKKRSPRFDLKTISQLKDCSIRGYQSLIFTELNEEGQNLKYYQ